MIFKLLSVNLFILLLFATSNSFASTAPRSVEAKGTATLINGDLTNARRLAINNAMEIASLRAAAFVSSNTRVQEGLITESNTRVSSQGLISDVQVIHEQLIGDQLEVFIRASVVSENGCAGGHSQLAYYKHIGFTAFPLQQASHANLGSIHDISTRMPQILARELQAYPGFESHVATHISLHPDIANSPTQILSDGTLTNLQRHSEQSNMQFIVSGVIRDISSLDPPQPGEPNVFAGLFKRLAYSDEKNLRALIADIYIHDAQSGGLLWQNRYRTAGRWERGQEKTGFGSEAFWRQDYGQQVRNTLIDIIQDINSQLQCEPFRARITKASENRLWINAGSLSGLNSGDRLTVYRRFAHYDTLNQPMIEFTNTQVTLTLDAVQPTFASGTIDRLASQVNIQQDDIVKSQ